MAACRKAVYQLMLSLMVSSLPRKPSPDQVVMKAFSLGINDPDFEVQLLEHRSKQNKLCTLLPC